MWYGCEAGAKSSTLAAMIPLAEASGNFLVDTVFTFVDRWLFLFGKVPGQVQVVSQFLLLDSLLDLEAAKVRLQRL